MSEPTQNPFLVKIESLFTSLVKEYNLKSGDVDTLQQNIVNEFEKVLGDYVSQNGGIIQCTNCGEAKATHINFAWNQGEIGHHCDKCYYGKDYVPDSCQGCGDDMHSNDNHLCEECQRLKDDGAFESPPG